MKFLLILTAGCIIFAGSLLSDWVSTGGAISTYTVNSLVTSGGNIFAGTNPYGVYVSTDNGSSWVARNNGLPSGGGLIHSMCVMGTTVYATVWGYGIWATTNNGTSWSPRTGADSYSRTIATDGTNLYAGGLYGLYISTNGGTNWVSSSNGIPTGAYPVTSFAFSGGNIYAGCYSTTGGVYMSSNGGLNWIAKNNGIFQLSTYSLFSGGSYLLAGVAASPSAFKSVDNGNNWDASGVGLQNHAVNSIIQSGSNLIAGTAGGVFYSTNQGDNWLNMSAGIPQNQGANTLLITGGYIYAAISTIGVWKRGVSEVGITVLGGEVPGSYSLSQNYPNPFNPTTKFRFQLPNSSAVKLSIYDVLGKEAAVVVNDELSAGTYEVDFDGSRLSSGVYYYRLSAGDPSKGSGQFFTAVKKMILVK